MPSWKRGLNSGGGAGAAGAGRGAVARGAAGLCPAGAAGVGVGRGAAGACAYADPAAITVLNTTTEANTLITLDPFEYGTRLRPTRPTRRCRQSSNMKL